VRPEGALLRWSVFKNAVAQIAGRNFIALGRLVIAGMIVRRYGITTFGEYSLVFGILAIAEWLLDFGTTEVFVREICREPERGRRLLGMMTAVKLIQIPVATAGLLVILLVLRYPARIVDGALVGGCSLLFFSGVLIYRVIFKAGLTIEREVAAESVSVLVMIPLVALAGSYKMGFTALLGCHLISRATFLGMCFLFGRSSYRPSFQGVTWHDVQWIVNSSTAIGFVGFLVVIYEALDVLLLSKLGEASDLAYYSGAQRLVWPMLMALTSIGATLYPVVASYWPDARNEFEVACQRGIDIVALLAGFAVCLILAGAEFFMGLLGRDIVAGSAALRVLALLCFVKAITATVGPVLYVINAQRYALQFITVAVVMKTLIIAALVRPFSYMGVAWGALIVEVIFAAAPAVFLLQRLTGLRVRWGVPAEAALLAVGAAVLPRLVVPGGLAAAVIAAAIYSLFVFLSGAVRFSELHSLMRVKTS